MSLRTPRPGERGFQDWKDLADAFDAIGGVPACGALVENHIEPPQAEPAPVANLHPKTADLVQRFATALAEKLAAAEKKYGYSDGWASSDWMGECRLKLREHLLKGDPRDVAAYCAFLWHHGESTALPIEEAEQLFRAPEPAQAADSVLKDHQIAALVNELRDIAIEFHGAQQLRERIAQVVVPALKAKSADSVLEDAARDLLAQLSIDYADQIKACADHWAQMVRIDNGDQAEIEKQRHAALVDGLASYAIDTGRKQGRAA